MIPTEIYRSLTPAQRIAATIAAIARNDDRERQTLIESCPRKTYRQIDSAFTDRLERLRVLSLAIECELRGCALDWSIAIRLADNFAADAIEAQARAIAAGWQALIGEIGVDQTDMTAAGCPQHVSVTALLAVGDPPDQADVTASLDALRGFLNPV